MIEKSKFLLNYERDENMYLNFLTSLPFCLILAFTNIIVSYRNTDDVHYNYKYTQSQYSIRIKIFPITGINEKFARTHFNN